MWTIILHKFCSGCWFGIQIRYTMIIIHVGWWNQFVVAELHRALHSEEPNKTTDVVDIKYRLATYTHYSTKLVAHNIQFRLRCYIIDNACMIHCTTLYNYALMHLADAQPMIMSLDWREGGKMSTISGEERALSATTIFPICKFQNHVPV